MWVFEVTLTSPLPTLPFSPSLPTTHLPFYPPLTPPLLLCSLIFYSKETRSRKSSSKKGGFFERGENTGIII